MLAIVQDVAEVQCPYCFEMLEIYVDPDTVGSYVEDCAVCCRPWQVSVHRDPRGDLTVHVSRAQ